MPARTGQDKTSTGIVYNIQRYSLHDGPGIRTTVFLKGCPLRCFWCQNPESQATKPEILLNKDACTLCGRCVKGCVTGAALLSERSAIIKRDKCIGCGKCAAVCPADARGIAGREMAVDEVLSEVLRDKAMYDNSQGGITLSGGEPTVQSEFTLQLLRKSKEKELHTVIETCGHVSWSILKSLLEFTDLVFFDIKCLDPMKHLKATGKDNTLILDNALKVAREKTMRVRMPLIPGFNDHPEDVKAVVRFAKEGLALNPSEIELLRYNQLGEAKYDRLDRPDERLSLEPQTEEYMETMKGIAKTG